MTCLVWGMLKCPTLTLKSCSKCHKMPKSNFLFLGVTFMVGGYAEMPHPNPKSCSKCHKMPKSTFLFLGATFMVGGMLKCPTLTLTLKVVPNVTKCLNPTCHFWVQRFMVGESAEMTHPSPKPTSCSKCHKMPKSNFSFLGVTRLVGGILKIPHPNLKIQIFNCPYEIEIHKFSFQA